MTKKENEVIIQKKCQVCEQIMSLTKYKLNKCPHCGWLQSGRGWEFPDRVIAPNLISLDKAKQLYGVGKSFEPNFEDFIGGLMFYAEMEFFHDGIKYAVHFLKGDIIIYNTKTQAYTSYKDESDFRNNANINGAKLRDIWHEVKDAGWLS